MRSNSVFRSMPRMTLNKQTQTESQPNTTKECERVHIQSEKQTQDDAMIPIHDNEVEAKPDDSRLEQEKDNQTNTEESGCDVSHCFAVVTCMYVVTWEGWRKSKLL